MTGLLLENIKLVMLFMWIGAVIVLPCLGQATPARHKRRGVSRGTVSAARDAAKVAVKALSPSCVKISGTMRLAHSANLRLACGGALPASLGLSPGFTPRWQ